jgi:transcriptional regulator GlxA family with amidase domain
MNLALALIEEDYGPHLARAVADETRIIAPAETPTVNLDTPPRPIDRFGELVGWVMRNLDSDLSVEVLARRACMSKDTFSRAFKSVFGVPPSEFVENLRLNEARRRLAAPHRTLQTVAASVGFSSPDKFSSAFERRFGVRPHRFLESTPRVLNRPAAAA